MDSRATQSHAHEYNEHQHPHNFGSQQVAHGAEEHHDDHEKKSVLKKVKAKAKKIKDTITKHGHHDHEHGPGCHYEDQHIPDDHDLDEDEDMVQDPEIHGAPIYDSAAVRNVTPGQVKTSGPEVKFGGATVAGEPHNEPRVVVASPATEINQSRSSDPVRTFVREENKAVQQPNVNLERPMDLVEHPHAPGSRPGAYASANYQTKVTDPTGAGGAEIDITPVQKSFARMTVHNEAKPNTEPKILPTIAETQYPSAGRDHQFAPELSAATKTPYPSTVTHDQNLPELSSEIKTQYPKTQYNDQFTPDLSTSTKTQHPYHDQNLSELSSATRTQYPSAGSHDQFTPELLQTEPKPQHPSATSHDQNLPQYSSVTTETQYPFTTSHDQNLPQYSSATKTQYPSATSHDQFSPELPTEPKHQYPSTTSHDQTLPQYSTATKTQYPLAGSHDQFTPGLPTEHKSEYPSDTFHDQSLPQSSAIETQYPSSRINDQFTPQLPTEHRPQFPSDKSHEQYLPQQFSATKSQYPSAGSHDQFTPELPTEPKPQYPSDTIHDQSLPQSSAIETQYRSAGSHDQFTPEFPNNNIPFPVEENPRPHNESMEKQSNQSSNSYTDKIYLATAAVADKAITAKNAVASKLGYGEKGENENETTRSGEKEKASNQQSSSYTEKLSSAKNTVASKLGFGEKNQNEREDSNVTSHEEKNNIENVSSATSAPPGSTAEYGKRIAVSLTEKLAPVYGVGRAVKSKVPGTESRSEVSEQEKGVSMKDYLAEKLRPGEDDRALSEVISESLYKKGSEHESVEGDDERREVPRGKVTESEAVKRRLGSWEDEEREKGDGESPGKVVVDKIKGVVGSWFGSSGENQIQSQQGGEDLSRDSGVEVEEVNQGVK